MIDYDINDEVICVDARRTRPEHAFMLQWPVKDKKYTVRGFTDNDGIVTGVYLKELKNRVVFIKLLGREQEEAFAPWRFKKCQKISAEEKSVLQEIKGNTKEVKDYKIKEVGVDKI